MKKIIAALFIGMIVCGTAAAAESGYTWQDNQNLELDGNLYSADC